MLTLNLYGIDHSRAPLDVREELAFSGSEAREVLPRLLSPKGGIKKAGSVAEALLLSTCNRTEVYLAVAGEPGAYPLAPLRDYRPGASALDDHCVRYHLHGQEALKHLFAVAASLRSQVPGDTQIARQLAAAAETAREAGTLGGLLEPAVVAALRSARRVRRETGLMAGRSSTGSEVLHAIRRFAPRDAREGRPLRILLLGAGAIAEEVASHLSGYCGDRSARNASCRSVEIAGIWARDRQKASRFGETFGVRAFSEGQALAALETVDAVVGCCRGRVGLLGEPALGECLIRRAAPLVVVDLGVPRNLDPKLAERDGLHAVFLDQLHIQMRERGRRQMEAVREGERIVDEELARLEARMAKWPLRPFRAEVYSSVEAVLGRWRAEQPVAVHQLRVALHRTLEAAFRSAICASGVLSMQNNQTRPTLADK